jgi:hypothetical protein
MALGVELATIISSTCINTKNCDAMFIEIEERSIYFGRNKTKSNKFSTKMSILGT